MKESEFQVFYERYHNSEAKTREKILQNLHHYVYQYALKRFRAEDDMASDFYMKMYDRIERFFHDYDPKRGISFAVYLAVTLKRNYLKFFSVVIQKENIYQDSVHQNPEIPWDPPSYDEPPESGEKLNAEKLVLEAINFLNMNKQISLRLYFGFYLCMSHLKGLLKIHGDLNFFPLYRQYLQEVRAWTVKEFMTRKNILEKVEKEYFRSQQNIKNFYVKKRRDHLIEEFYKIKTPISLIFVSRLIKKSTSQVHRLIHTAKEELKFIFHEKFQGILEALGITQTKI